MIQFHPIKVYEWLRTDFFRPRDHICDALAQICFFMETNEILRGLMATESKFNFLRACRNFLWQKFRWYGFTLEIFLQNRAAQFIERDSTIGAKV